MIRRSRISIRPNIRPTSRVPAASQDAALANKSDLNNDQQSENEAPETSVENKPDIVVPQMKGSDQTLQSQCSHPAVNASNQSTPVSPSVSLRRKRFSALPNLSKPRATQNSTQTLSNSPKSTSNLPPDIIQAPSDPCKSPVIIKPTPEVPSDFPKPSQLSPSFTLKSPIPKSGSKLPTVSHPTIGYIKSRIPNSSALIEPNDKPLESELTNQDVSDSAEYLSHLASVSESHTDVDTGKQEKKKNEVTSGKEVQTSAGYSALSIKTLKDPVDMIRLARAKKLRDLLKEELNKKKKEKQQKPRVTIKEHLKVKDHTKMTMRELIYYLPSTNPMKSHNEDEQQAEMPPPLSPKCSPTALPASDEEATEEEEQGETKEEEPLLAPRVKVAEDGSLIIDEESLTVQVQRQKGPSVVEDRDPIFERGSTTTYSSFRKGTYTKPWSIRETDMFFLAISMVGTDFSMISQLFPHRARVEIKNKYKKEEKANAWRIDKAFKKKRRLDLDFFNSLLKKILKDDEGKCKETKVSCRTQAVRESMVNSSVSEEGDESLSSNTTDREKENENICN